MAGEKSGQNKRRFNTEKVYMYVVEYKGSVEKQKGAIAVQNYMKIAPFWFSREHLWMTLPPFWFSSG